MKFPKEEIMKRLVLLTGLAAWMLAACTLTTPEPTTTPAPIFTATFSPTLTPTVIPTATLARVTLTVKDTLINCRFGPGVGYAFINELSQGESARVIGRDELSTWWYIRDPRNPNGSCWVSASVTETQGPADQLPVVESPIPTVTKVNLRLEPTRIVVNCDQFPQTVFFEAEITVNGPTYMTWRWEASTGVSSTDGLLVYGEAGTKIINDYYQIAAPNEYWIQLHILTPNESVTQVAFPASCTP
jgi:SH3-like domain-containing protein